MSSITLVKRDTQSCPFDWHWHSLEKINEALRIVFEYLPYVTLCNCAVVSKTWRKLVLNELDSRCAVTVQNDNQVRYVLQQLQKRSNLNFRVGKCMIASPCVDSNLVNQMCTRIQTTLHILKMETPYISQDTFYVIKLLTNLPNLTHLSIISTCIASEITDKNDHLTDNNNSSNFRSENSWFAPFSRMPEKTIQQQVSSQCQDKNNGKILHCAASIYRDDEESSIFVHRNIRFLLFDAGQDARFQLSKLFHAFPSLVELNVANVVDEPRKHFKCQCAPSSSLQHLALRQYSNISFHEKLVQMLLKLDLRLEKLMLIFHQPPTQSSFKSPQATNALLKQFIESQGTTLKSLKLVQVEDNVCCDKDYSRHLNKPSRIDAVRNFHVDSVMDTRAAMKYYWNFNYSAPSYSLFPMTLQNLEVLHVQKPLITNLAQVLNYFPKLRQLSIQVSQYGTNWKGMLPQKLESHPKLTAFKLDFIDLESFFRLGQCFPALQTFQMAYCDESLFSVLCKRIPYFNGVIAKEKLISCPKCHAGGRCEDLRFGLSASMKEEIEKLCLESKTLVSFKNLKQLKVRPCHHYPYENFVFLRREIPEQNTSTTTVANPDCQHDGFENGSFDSSTGFSWNDADILTEQEFIDLHINPSENTESCSSA